MKTESNQLQVVLSSLTSSLAAVTTPTKLSDPTLKECLNSHEIMHQFALLDRIVDRLAANPDNPALDSLFLRTLNLVGRTRTRFSREEPGQESPVQTAEREEARTFLLTELSSGPRPAKDLFLAASKLGISKKTLYRAKTELNVLSQQIHSNPAVNPKAPLRYWIWTLPSASEPESVNNLTTT